MMNIVYAAMILVDLFMCGNFARADIIYNENAITLDNLSANWFTANFIDSNNHDSVSFLIANDFNKTTIKWNTFYAAPSLFLICASCVPYSMNNNQETSQQILHKNPISQAKLNAAYDNLIVEKSTNILGNPLFNITLGFDVNKNELQNSHTQTRTTQTVQSPATLALLGLGLLVLGIHYRNE